MLYVSVVGENVRQKGGGTGAHRLAVMRRRHAATWEPRGRVHGSE